MGETQAGEPGLQRSESWFVSSRFRLPSDMGETNKRESKFSRPNRQGVRLLLTRQGIWAKHKPETKACSGRKVGLYHPNSAYQANKAKHKKRASAEALKTIRIQVPAVNQNPSSSS